MRRYAFLATEVGIDNNNESAQRMICTLLILIQAIINFNMKIK